MKERLVFLTLGLIILFTGCAPKIESKTYYKLDNELSCISPYKTSPKSNFNKYHNNLYELTNKQFTNNNVNIKEFKECELIYYADYSVFKNETRKINFSEELIKYNWSTYHEDKDLTYQSIYRMVVATYDKLSNQAKIVWEGIQFSTSSSEVEESSYSIDENDEIFISDMVGQFYKDMSFDYTSSGGTKYTLNLIGQVLVGIGQGAAAFAEGYNQAYQPTINYSYQPIQTNYQNHKTKPNYNSSSYECSSDLQCGYGKKCVKAMYQSTGTCMNSVNSSGVKTYNAPSPNIGINTSRQCRFTTDCPVGFQCVSGNCIK